MLRYLIEHHNVPVTFAGMMHNHWMIPLMQAARDSGVDMIRLLLQHAAEVDVGSSLSPMIGELRSPLTEALRGNHRDIAQILVGMSSPIFRTRELSMSVQEKNFPMTEMQLDNGTHPEFRQEDVPEPQAFLDGSLWLQPLLLAVINRDLDTVELLLNKGANPNVWCSYQSEDSFVVFYNHVLFWAFEYGHKNWRDFQKRDDAEYLAMVKLLLEAGANPNKFDMFGQTTLTYAIKAGHETVVKCLLDHSANPYWTVNKSGQKLRSVPKTKESIRAMLEEDKVKQYPAYSLPVDFKVLSEHTIVSWPGKKHSLPVYATHNPGHIASQYSRKRRTQRHLLKDKIRSKIFNTDEYLQPKRIYNLQSRTYDWTIIEQKK